MSMFQTFERRLDTVDRVIRKKMHYQEPDLWAWKWLKELLRNLGEQGMSSDETEVDNQGRTYFSIKKLPWRARVECQLKMIDDRRMQERSELNRKGAVPTTRLRTNNAVASERSPPQKRPKGVFDKHWLQECPVQDVRKLRISNEEFNIIDIGS
jgi:hypothetical protein